VPKHYRGVVVCQEGYAPVIRESCCHKLHASWQAAQGCIRHRHGRAYGDERLAAYEVLGGRPVQVDGQIQFIYEVSNGS